MFRSAEYESKLQDAQSAVKRYKTYYKLFKNAKTLQWKYCDAYYKAEEFVGHSQLCTTNKYDHSKSQKLSDIKATIIQTLIKEDEITRRPFTEYVIQVKQDNKKWTVNRKYKEFWLLHTSLVSSYPNVEFPKSASRFWNKTISEIK